MSDTTTTTVRWVIRIDPDATYLAAAKVLLPDQAKTRALPRWVGADYGMGKHAESPVGVRAFRSEALARTVCEVYESMMPNVTLVRLEKRP